MADGHNTYNNISLVGSNVGQLKVHSRGLVWRKQGGDEVVKVGTSNISSITWMKVPRSNQLGVLTKDDLKYYKFVGFPDQDVSSLTNFFKHSYGITPEEKQLSVSGKNWGELGFNGNMLSFLVDSKQAMEVSLADVAQTQLQGKTDVTLEFNVDDTAGANEKDELMELSFYIPTSNTQFVGDEDRTPAQVFRERIMSMANVGSGGEEAVVTFDTITILTPRGRYNVELHLSFLRLQGQATDFKIQYSSIVRVFVLPKSNQPHTFVVVTLDPPIRKGQTLYPHIVMQFETDHVFESTLVMNKDLYDTKYKNKLEPEYKGLIHEVFTMVLRGLSGTKTTRPGKFRSCQDGYAVKSSLKAEDGMLYPLEKTFFFLPKPPTLILHDEIDYVEFERHAAGGSNMHYFDLVIRLKSEQEHIFRNIQRNEYHNLFDFISSKGLKIMNMGAGLQAAECVAAQDNLERIVQVEAAVESDEEDEDFVADKDDDGSPSDDSGGDDSDGSASGGEQETIPKKVSKKEATTFKTSSIKRKNTDEGSSKKKKQKKKDPNAPKGAMSSFMYFSQLEREKVKKDNPGIGFTEIGRVLGERWHKLTAEQKAPYEAKAQADKKRYMNEMGGYNKNSSQTTPMYVDESDSN